MATAQKTTSEKTAAGVPAITVTSRSPMGSIYRAGRQWGPTDVTVPVSEFKKEQLDALRAEPLLVVSDTTIDTPAPSDTAQG
jgi:hypothetical protein